MGALSNIHWDFVPQALGILIMAVLSYVAGRMQQFHQQSTEREQAFVNGYNMATMSLFSLATRTSKAMAAPPLMEAPTEVKPTKMSRGVVKVGRHSVDTGGISTLQKTAQFTAWDEYKRVA